MIYESVCKEARAVSMASGATPMPPSEWESTLGKRRQMWLEMLGLDPLPDRAPIEATVTGELDRGDYVVEKVHFQPIPGAYVAGNIYRPAEITEPLPAVLYLCGHSKGKVNPPYQANPRWFGRHGYVALVVDPIQLGECQGLHAGTFGHNRWDWCSRGYTPAGTEVWIGMRAFDYLAERDDVDPERMGVTGLSGGGVISWCLGAADERAKCVVPVCQTGSIEHVVTDRATDGHCDCAFFINYHRWCQPDIGALIAPRPLLVAAGTEDVLWRPYAFRDVCHRIKHQYGALGVAENTDLVEDLTPHGYTPKLRKAIFEWFNYHLKGDCNPVTDDVTEYVEPEENLLVFGGTLPTDDKMKTIDELLVKEADVSEPADAAEWEAQQAATLGRLRALTFQYVANRPAPRFLENRADGATATRTEPIVGTTYGTRVFEAPDGLTLRVRTAYPTGQEWPVPTVAFALQPDAKSGFTGGGASRPSVPTGIATAGVEVRNTGVTSVGPGYLWTLRRVYPLLGQTLPERQVADLLDGIAIMRADASTGPVAVFGDGYTAPLAIYAALMDADIAEVILTDPPETRRLYEKLGAGGQFRVIDSLSDWQPAS